MNIENLINRFPPADIERASYLWRDLELINNATRPQTLLDMGTGSGSMSAVVALKFPGISGRLVDVDARLEHLDLIPEENRVNLEFELWPCEEKLQGMVFDLVMSMDVLEHIPDWRTAIEALKNYVADDGLLYIQTPSNYPSPNWPTLSVFINRFKGIFDRHNPASHVRHGLSCKSIVDAVGNDFEPLVASESYVVGGKSHCSFKPRTHLLLRRKCPQTHEIDR